MNTTTEQTTTTTTIGMLYNRELPLSRLIGNHIFFPTLLDFPNNLKLFNRLRMLYLSYNNLKNGHLVFLSNFLPVFVHMCVYTCTMLFTVQAFVKISSYQPFGSTN